ncbi:YggU family protein [bacterium]|nr:YggU family protein [bacterium]
MPKQILKIHLQPNAKRNEICGIYDNEYIKIAITTPPIDGKANETLIKFLSKELKIPKSNITITKGLTSRNKTIEIESEKEIILKTSLQ